MDRVFDYTRFAVSLFGVGYLVLWPLLSHDNGGPIGASLICPSPLGFLCRFPHPLALPPGLQWIGVLSAGWVCLRLGSRLVARLRQARARRVRAASALSARIPATVRSPRQKPLAPLRQVKPRRQFGLRGRPE